jgi:hypothetical protein
MDILCLDDSGSVMNKNEQYFVLGGLSVPENSLRWLSLELEKLASEIDPDNPRGVEFHAASIFGGREGIWKRFSKQQRIQIIKRVLLVLQNAYSDVVLFACAIHKDSFPADDLVKRAFEDLCSRFNIYLQRVSPPQPRKGLIVLDKSSYETSLQDLAATLRDERTRWGSYVRNLCEVPLFVDSKASRITQLADHIAYAVFRRYSAGDLNYFNCIEGRFDHDAGKMHGLVHLQLYNRDCTCPACLTRR